MNDRRTYLKVKLKSLAAEAKIIRQEEKKAKKYKDQELLSGLEWHRKDTVRSAARHTLLAYAFIRGAPYKKVEAKCEKAPNWERVFAMVKRYGRYHLWLANYDPEHSRSWKTAAESYDEERTAFFAWVGIPIPEPKKPQLTREQRRLADLEAQVKDLESKKSKTFSILAPLYSLYR